MVGVRLVYGWCMVGVCMVVHGREVKCQMKCWCVVKCAMECFQWKWKVDDEMGKYGCVATTKTRIHEHLINRGSIPRTAQRIHTKLPATTQLDSIVIHVSLTYPSSPLATQ